MVGNQPEATGSKSVVRSNIVRDGYIVDIAIFCRTIKGFELSIGGDVSDSSGNVECTSSISEVNRIGSQSREIENWSFFINQNIFLVEGSNVVALVGKRISSQINLGASISCQVTIGEVNSGSISNAAVGNTKYSTIGYHRSHGCLVECRKNG